MAEIKHEENKAKRLQLFDQLCNSDQFVRPRQSDEMSTNHTFFSVEPVSIGRFGNHRYDTCSTSNFRRFLRCAYDVEFSNGTI